MEKILLSATLLGLSLGICIILMGETSKHMYSSPSVSFQREAFAASTTNSTIFLEQVNTNANACLTEKNSISQKLFYRLREFTNKYIVKETYALKGCNSLETTN